VSLRRPQLRDVLRRPAVRLRRPAHGARGSNATRAAPRQAGTSLKSFSTFDLDPPGNANTGLGIPRQARGSPRIAGRLMARGRAIAPARRSQRARSGSSRALHRRSPARIRRDRAVMSAPARSPPAPLSRAVGVRVCVMGCGAVQRDGHGRSLMVLSLLGSLFGGSRGGRTRPAQACSDPCR
jgi:hypothetical protein